MRKFMSLLLLSSFLAAASVFAGEEAFLFGEVEYVLPEIDPGFGPVNSISDSLAARRNCPGGWERVPQYRWNQRSHRWEFSGWTCRRQRK